MFILITQYIANTSRHLLVQSQLWKHQNNVYKLFKVNNINTRTGVFIVNFEQILLIVLVFPLLTLNKITPVGQKVATFIILGIYKSLGKISCNLEDTKFPW